MQSHGLRRVVQKGAITTDDLDIRTRYSVSDFKCIQFRGFRRRIEGNDQECLSGRERRSGREGETLDRPTDVLRLASHLVVLPKVHCRTGWVVDFDVLQVL